MLTNRSTVPVIQANQPWEQNAFLFAVSVLPDETDHGLRLYYLARFSGNPSRNLLCLACSPDGRSWSKPDCGDGTNILMRGAGHVTDWGEFMPATVLRDPLEPDPALRWKMLYWDRPDPSVPSGICLATSADGLHWTPRFTRPVMTNANDAMSMVDVIPGHAMPFGIGRVLIYQQTWAYNPRLPTNRDNLKSMHRRISVWAGDAFAGNAVGPITILEPDPDDPADLQFYWLTPFQTAWGGYGGLLNAYHTREQTMDVQLVSSPDGWTWSRELDRRPLLPLGARGQFDCGMVCAVAKPILWDGRVLLFYNGSAVTHDGKPVDPGTPDPRPSHGIGMAECRTELLDIGAPGVA